MNIKYKIQSKCSDGRPMYRGIEQHFADLIIRREFSAGDKLPSINEVAASAGINSRTVMQAYQCLVGRGMVEVRHGMGTFVTDIQKNNQKVIIGVAAGWDNANLDSGYTNHYGQLVYAGILEEASNRDADCKLLKISTGMIKECRDKDISGCILMGMEPSSGLLLDALEYEKLKTVTISGRDDQHIPLVHGDDTQGMQLLMRHLFELGHKRIALFYGNPGNYSAQRRFRAYQNEMIQAHLNIHPSWICDDSQFGGNPEKIDHLFDVWFKGDRSPTAIIAAGEHSALATLQVLNAKGVRVPRDVSVCGYDDFSGIQEFATPALTAVRQPVAEIGRTAVRNLIALLGGEKVEHAVLPVELIVRASTVEAIKDR